VARRGVDNDPLSAPATAALAQALCANGRYDAALAALQRISALRPPLRRTAGFAGLCYARQGKWLAAIAELRQVATMDTRYFSMLGYVLARAGQREEARRIHAALLAQWQRSHEGAYDVARVYAGLGERDQAGVWLEKSVDDRSLRQIELEPLFGDLRGDARYERLLQRLGLQKR
jgi:tetratricopeptide (TPR) repeat protein